MLKLWCFLSCELCHKSFRDQIYLRNHVKRFTVHKELSSVRTASKLIAGNTTLRIKSMNTTLVFNTLVKYVIRYFLQNNLQKDIFEQFTRDLNRTRLHYARNLTSKKLIYDTI